ncbi:MAG: hypothetical protein LBV50_08485 [Novosphingobium sp.]|nr:hypothetical protein [Novosphingobium sp.]
MILKTGYSLSAGVALVGAISLAGCTQAPPPAAPPPPPPVVVVPPQPQPPRGAQTNLPVPQADASGVRQTVNAGISRDQATWNLRSAFNVAALNCMQAQHSQILENYRAFLTDNVKRLAAVNKALDQEFKTRYGKGSVARRETYMTQVYNYFALPPTLPAFCDAALAVGNQARTVPAAGLDAFAARSLPEIERVFLEFFRSYEQYRVDLAGWQMRYTPSSLPAPMAARSPVDTLPVQAAAQPLAK